MNGYQTGGGPYDYGNARFPPPASNAGPRMGPDTTRKNMLDTLDKDVPSSTANHRSKAVDLKDPIQVHLLTETALTDSKDYEIITQEEVDELKKQSVLMSQRVESTRTNLAVQAKYRDAAISMAKLYAPSNANGQPVDERQLQEAEREREVCQRKCDDLERELFNLEKRLLVPQRRLLEHTAGILQLTHKVSKKKAQQQNGQLVNGIPGSPESLYTYSHSRNSLDPSGDDNYFDDPSLYQLDGMDGIASGRQPRKNAIEIPMKSPIREQANQLRGDMDRIRDENTTLVKSILETERKLESLNGSLRDTIVKFNPEVNKDYLQSPQESAMQGMKPVERLKNQVEYLESGLVAVQAEQDSLGGRSIGGQTADESGPVLTELWDTIQNGLVAMKQEKDERRRVRTEKGLPDDDEMSDDEGIDVTATYSLPAFSERVRVLYRQASTLKDQKSVLKRQIKQQRELNNKSDAEKDDEIQRKQQELDQSRELVERAEKDAMDAQKMLSQALEDSEKAQEAQSELQASTQRIKTLEADLKQAQEQTKSTGSKVADVDAKMSSLTSQLEEAQAAQKVAEEATNGLQREMKDKKLKLRQNEDEMEALNMTLAELKTEVTIARAELDGAYGSRAERAADVAALKNNAEILKLSNQITKLKKELAGTVEDLENITKETIGAEREKTELESKLDEALSAQTALKVEAEKAREKVTKVQEELDAERLKAPGHANAAKPGAGASMLSEQFRATMREERKKFQEDIREERARARKLEEELNRLKRSQGPGKSPLSPR